VIKDCSIIEDGSVLPPETTVASFMKYSQNGKIEGGQGTESVPSAMQDLMIDYTKSFYEHFVPSYH
jgi:dynactin 5